MSANGDYENDTGFWVNQFDGNNTGRLQSSGMGGCLVLLFKLLPHYTASFSRRLYSS